MIQASILLVDDDIATLQVLTWRLRSEGFSITPVSNGTEAIRALQDAQYDVVITDLIMEGIDGIEVLTTVKNIAPLTPVIIISGHSEYEMDAFLRGADHYLVKPFDIEELTLKIRYSLQNLQHPTKRIVEIEEA